MVMTEQDRALALETAWAIVRSYPGKEALMIEQFERQKIEVYRPSKVRFLKPAPHVVVRSSATPLFPGYVFVRPEVGQRWRLTDQFYVAHLLNRVLYDQVILAIREYEQEKRRVDIVEHDNQVRTRIVKMQRRTLTSFADLRKAVLIADSDPVDTNRLDSLFMALVTENKFRVTDTLDAYLRTDASATDPAKVSAVAMVKGTLRFQENQ